MKPDTTNFTALEPVSPTSVASGHPCGSSLPSIRGRHAYGISIVAVPDLDETSLDETGLDETGLGKTSLDETSAANAVPESVRLALGILNRRADQQCLVDGITQLNGGRGGATQMGHRDGNDIGARSPGRHDDAGGEHDVDQAVVVSVRRAEFEKNNGSGG